MTFRTNVFVILVTIAFLSISAVAQTTEVAYQGSLNNAGVAANGNYDFEFRLYDALTGEILIGPVVSRGSTLVSNGNFSVNLDFGSVFTGADRFLEIRVRPTGGGGFTILEPRNRVRSAPHAIQSLNAANATNAANAANADSATNAATAANALQLGGVAANQYVTAASGNASYVQNSTMQQPSSNFNISGTGTAGIFSAATQFNIGNSRVLSLGSGSTYVGSAAGAANPTGTANTFVGNSAGAGTTTGFRNSFFGSSSGVLNTGGCCNAFFGYSAGSVSTGAFNSFFGDRAGVATTTGGNNAFFGSGAGDTNVTGANNTVIGNDADVGASGLTFATALGAGSTVTTSNTVALGRATDTVQVPGNLNVTGAFVGTLPAGSSNYIQNTTSQQGTSNFYVSGDGRAGGTLWGTVVRANQFNIGNDRVLFATGVALGNTFVGANAGTDNTGVTNAFFGSSSGAANTDGGRNAFFGYSSGSLNITGDNNSFFGYRAGARNTANNNSFFGSGAGDSNTTGEANTYIGMSAGAANMIGYQNTFIGAEAGKSITNGFSNTFVGYLAGSTSAVNSANTYMGAEAGRFSTGGLNTFIGNNTGGPGGGDDNVFVGNAAGNDNTTGSGNTFVGSVAGQGNDTGSENTFVGWNSGRLSDVGAENSFFGTRAGEETGIGNQNTFIGRRAGLGNYDGSFNTFVGESAGEANDSGNNNTIIGYRADVGTAALSYATAIGAAAIVSNSNSIVLGRPAGEDTVRIPGNTVITGATTMNGNLVFGSGGVALFASPITLTALGTSGGTALCRNGSSQLSFCSSSLRYKTKIASFGSGLDLIKQLKPITFEWKDSGVHDLGLGAEDVASIEPLLVTYNEKGEVEGVKYDRVGVVLLNAVKEQQKIIERQQSQIDSLIKLVCSGNTSPEICKEN